MTTRKPSLRNNLHYQASKSTLRYKSPNTIEEILNAANDNPKTHPYAKQKDVSFGENLKRGSWPQRSWRDALLVPLYNKEGEIRSIQAINEDGEKDFIQGHKMKGCFYPFGNIRDQKRVLIGEGLATVATVVDITGLSGVAAMDANNLMPVAMAVRSILPESSEIIILADNDAKDGKKNTGVGSALKAARCVDGRVATPYIEGQKCDFWDLWRQCGKTAVTETIKKATIPDSIKPRLPDPIPLELQIEEQTPYPIEALGVTLGSAARAIAASVQAPLAMAGQCVLGSASYLAQGHVNAYNIGAKCDMPSSLFLLTLGQSGDRKSQCRKLAFQEIDENERRKRQNFQRELNDHQEQERMRTKKDTTNPRNENPLPQDPQTLYSDITFERLAGDFIRGTRLAAVDSDEGAQWLGGHSLKADTRRAALGGLTKLFDDGKVQRDRAASNPEGSGIAYDRRLTFSLLAQPTTVREALNDQLLRDQGFLPRFLFAAPDSLAGTRLLTKDDLNQRPQNDPYLKTYWNRCKSLLEESKISQNDPGNSMFLAVTDEAQEIWLKFYNDSELKQKEGNAYFSIRPFASRAGELVCRLATILAYFEREREISAQTMRNACDLVAYSLNEWHRYISSSDNGGDHDDAKRLLNWMKKKDKPVDLEAIRSSHHKTYIQSIDRARKLVKILLDHHLIIEEDNNTYSVRPVPDLPDLPGNPMDCGARHARILPDDAREKPTNGSNRALSGTSGKTANPENTEASGRSGISGSNLTEKQANVEAGRERFTL